MMISSAPIRIEDELANSYLDYAMSVIVSRALPSCAIYFSKSFFQDIKSLNFYFIPYCFSVIYSFLYQVSVVIQTSALMWASLSHFKSRL